MPRIVFNDDLEKKLIELWAEYQSHKSGQMVKRSVKEKEITGMINAYARELYGQDADEFAVNVIHNKIDNLKAKAREHYRKFRRETCTGAPVEDPGSDAAYDMEAAFANWGNFKTWHQCFKDVPAYGPLNSLNTSTIASLSTSHSASSHPVGNPLLGESVSRPAMHIEGSDEEERDLALLFAGGQPQRRQAMSAPAAASAVAAAAGSASNPTAIATTSCTASACATASTSCASATSGAGALDYVPGSHSKKRKRVSDVAVYDLDGDDSDDDGDDCNVDDTPGKSKKSKKVSRKNKRKPAGDDSAVAAAETLLEGLGKIQREQQQSTQTFMANLMAQQHAHTQALVQSQMVFLKNLFDGSSTDKN